MARRAGRGDGELGRRRRSWRGAAGAELVVDYRDEDVVAAVRAWAPDGVRRVVEVDLPANADVDAEVIGDVRRREHVRGVAEADGGRAAR